MWTPFEARFQKILNSIEAHQEIVREELAFASTGAFGADVQREAIQAEKRHQEVLNGFSQLNSTYNENSKGKRHLDPEVISHSSMV